jgi:hypothetical protein
MISKFFIIEKLLKGVTTSYVTLVPKNAHLTKLTEFRLISLIHGCTKLLGSCYCLGYTLLWLLLSVLIKHFSFQEGKFWMGS